MAQEVSGVTFSEVQVRVMMGLVTQQVAAALTLGQGLGGGAPAVAVAAPEGRRRKVSTSSTPKPIRRIVDEPNSLSWSMVALLAGHAVSEIKKTEAWEALVGDFDFAGKSEAQVRGKGMTLPYANTILKDLTNALRKAVSPESLEGSGPLLSTVFAEQFEEGEAEAAKTETLEDTLGKALGSSTPSHHALRVSLGAVFDLWLHSAVASGNFSAPEISEDSGKHLKGLTEFFLLIGNHTPEVDDTEIYNTYSVFATHFLAKLEKIRGDLEDVFGDNQPLAKIPRGASSPSSPSAP